MVWLLAHGSFCQDEPIPGMCLGNGMCPCWHITHIPPDPQGTAEQGAGLNQRITVVKTKTKLHGQLKKTPPLGPG